RPFWHYHPELELVYVNKGSGKRHIGSHLSYFHDGELILIGSNFPHQGFTNRLNGNETETVVHMKPDFLGNYFFSIPEMSTIRTMLEKSKRGLSFHGETKSAIGSKVEALYPLDPVSRIVGLIEILNGLATSDEYTVLNAEGFSMEVAKQDNDRINIVLNHIREHFQSHIALDDMAELISMTVPSFCRYFKKLTGKTFVRFVNDYRLVHAAKLLSEEQMSITTVCYESGFSNYSHFTKQFNEFSGKSPSKYRAEVKQILE
ncbi:MAG: AraC family transcriptional regulator, partial [Ekhidna sp.]